MNAHDQRRSPGAQVFRSRPVIRATGGDAIAIHCSDPRYQPHFRQFLEATVGAGRCSVLAIPGGPHCLTLTEYLPKFSWAGWRWLKFLVELAPPARILLVAHHDCRWYHEEGFLHPGETPVPRQIEDLHRVRASLTERFGQIPVELYFARLEGQEAVFEQV